MTLRNCIQSSRKREKQKCPLGMWVFLPKSKYITAYTLENFSYFKNKFLFINGNILEINDYYNKSRRNASFTQLSEIINTLSNQDLAELDKFRLRKNLGKIKEMRVKLNKINKSNRNESSVSDFLSSPFFSHVMANLAAGRSAGESASLILDKRESLESKLLRASSEKFLVCRRLYLY